MAKSKKFPKPKSVEDGGIKSNVIKFKRRNLLPLPVDPENVLKPLPKYEDL